MAIKTRGNLIFFGRATGAAKRWNIGWTADEAQSAARRTQGDGSQPRRPGAYGLLAGNGRR